LHLTRLSSIAERRHAASTSLAMPETTDIERGRQIEVA
jgi:hypothetical protein